MRRTYMRGYVQRNEEGGEGEDEGPLRIVAATEGRKADGLDLRLEGGDLSRFRSNPIVGYGHDYWGRGDLPIGRADRTWVDDDRLMMDVTFDQGDEFAREVERKYREGFLNSFSIGFNAEIDRDTGAIENWELLEVSAVPMAMDSNAVVESGRGEAAALLARALADGGLRDGVREQIRVAAAAPPAAALHEDSAPRPRLAAARRRLRVSGAGQ